MEDIYISGTGVWTPPHKISNDELVESFNKYVDLFNAENADQIENGSIIPLEHSSSEFIVKAKVLRHLSGPKIRVYKMRSKKKTRKTFGHRRKLTRILITSISKK